MGKELERRVYLGELADEYCEMYAVATKRLVKYFQDVVIPNDRQLIHNTVMAMIAIERRDLQQEQLDLSAALTVGSVGADEEDDEEEETPDAPAPFTLVSKSGEEPRGPSEI